MDIYILQRELDELIATPALFDPHNFRGRKEALAFLKLIERLPSVNSAAYRHFEESAKDFQQRLHIFDEALFRDFFARWQVQTPTPEYLFSWLLPYSDYVPGEWGRPHHGYEHLDILLEGAFLPEPHPEPSLTPQYGMVRYQPTPASVILELVERINQQETDVFYDLGSGLGKVTLLVHLLTTVKSVGVEYQPTFCTYADEQIARLGLREKVEYLNCDARDVDYAAGNIFFLFNPFGGTIFDTVLENIQAVASQKAIIICSYGSASQPLSELPWLEQIDPISDDEMALAIFCSK